MLLVCTTPMAHAKQVSLVQEKTGKERLLSDQESFTPTTHTVCHGMTCSVAVYPTTTYVFEDGIWKYYTLAHSLKGKGFTCIVEEGAAADDPSVVCDDFNATHVTLSKVKLGHAGTVPIRVLSPTPDKGSVVMQEQVALRNELSFSNAVDRQKVSLPVHVGEELHLGEHSTVVRVEATSGYGTVEYYNGYPWSSVRAAENGTTIVPYLFVRAASSGNIDIYRGILPYDTSAIPDNAVIDSAVLSVYAWFVFDETPNASVAVVGPTTQGDPYNLSLSDYSQVGDLDNPTEVAPRILLSDYHYGWNNHTLNAQGRALINKTGVTRLGMRISLDIDDDEPAINDNNNILVPVDGNNQPALYITYTLPNEEPTAHGSLQLVYDANGNLVWDGETYREYNSLNQLWKVYNGTDNSTLLVEYVYHPLEERVLVKKTFNPGGSLKETVYYFSKEFNRVVNASGEYNITYVYLNGDLIAEEVNGVKTFHHNDHLGSTSVLTDEAGNVIERTQYDPLGGIIANGSVSRYNYEAKEYDAVTGDTDFHFRQYQSEYGFFTQPDTLIQNVYDPQSLNRYMFERGNPYRYTDPTGHYQSPYANGGGPNPANYVDTAARYTFLFGFMPGLREQWNEDRRYEDLYAEWYAENPYEPRWIFDIPADPYDYDTQGNPYRKHSLEFLEDWESERNQRNADALFAIMYPKFNQQFSDQANQQKTVAQEPQVIKVSKSSRRSFTRKHRSTKIWESSLSQISKDLGLSKEMEDYIKEHRYDY